MVQFGQARLRFIDRNADGRGTPSGTGGKKGTTPAPQPPGGRLGTALMYAAGINVVGSLGNSLAAFLTELTPTWTWFITPFIGLLVALLIETLGYYRKGPGTPQRPPSGHEPRPHEPGPERRPAPQRPLAVTVLLTLLLLGGGGWLAAAGVSYAVGYFSGNEDGVQRLERQVVAEAQGVRVTVLGVQSTAHFTRVGILVSNGTSSSISLPLFQNALLTGPGGTTVDASAFRSNWQPKIPAGVQRREPSTSKASCPKGLRRCRSASPRSLCRASTAPRPSQFRTFPSSRWTLRFRRRLQGFPALAFRHRAVLTDGRNLPSGWILDDLFA
ncbi:hypothetical protein M1E17_06005 [Arthrobacter sp. D1-29]